MDHDGKKIYNKLELGVVESERLKGMDRSS